MLLTYKEKILRELEGIPEEMMPKLYNIIHMLVTDILPMTKKTVKRGSLKGIWKGCKIEESLFREAKKLSFHMNKRKK